MAAPSNPPLLGPTLPPTYFTTSLHIHQSPPSKSPIDFSPPLIAMVVVAAAAFLFITYSRVISRHLFPPFLRLFRHHRRRRRRLYPPSDINSPPPPYESSDGFYVYSPYGLDESVIKAIPLTVYNLGYVEIDDSFINDCAVCLLEFEDGERIRTLPHCCHSFHVDCIDMWLRSHATCPLCRAGVYVAPPPLESPLSPLMAARIRPSFDEGILLESMFLEPLPEVENSGEIQEVVLSPEIQSEDHHHRCHGDFLLKRSYSFGFERSFPSERIVMGAATTPYRFHHHHRERRSSFFWTKRPSSTPFSSLAKSRVFSFRRTMKSPSFFRRRGYFPMSESSASLRWYGGGGGGGSTVGSSRRVMMKPLASPLFGRGIFSSSRMRMGDPEALISPERYSRR